MARIMYLTLILVFLFTGVCNGRIHLLPLWDDERSIIVMTSFGYLQGGYLEVNITSMKITGGNQDALIGFSFDKSSSSGTSSYVEREESSHGCILEESKGSETFENVPRAILKIAHTGNNKYELQVKERGLQGLKIYPSPAAYGLKNGKVSTEPEKTSTTKATTTTLPTTSKKPETIEEDMKNADEAGKEPGPNPVKPKDTAGEANSAKDANQTPVAASVKSAGGPVPSKIPAAILHMPSPGTGNKPALINGQARLESGPINNGPATLRASQAPAGSPAGLKPQGFHPAAGGQNGPPGRNRRETDDEKKPDVKADTVTTKPPEDATKFVNLPSIPIIGNFHDGMNFSFYVRMEKITQVGLYELYFHNCENIGALKRNNDESLTKAGFTAHIVEKNSNSYLSAGDMALPTMYGVISVLFFIVGIVWLRMICTTKEKVFKIHYLMAVIIFVKGMSVMFHALDYYFIAKDGRTEAWAVIYYIVHLLKGILLIICLLLIGTGWAFIKYILSDRDKKLFMIVIPMQVMVNVAYIIMEETEEGNKSYYTWKNIVILVDVLCCGAILVPVVWSIRHLQEASQTDGKAAINLAKLELFRHFYIMVVCYLYFTRIIVYLLEITLPFQYIWIHAFFSELGAFIFFSVTGYKFRPGCDNPYLKLDQYDSDDDPEEAITQSGATENLTRVNQREVEETDEFDVLLPKQRTSKV